MVGTPPPLCSSPMLEINGTRAPHPVASQADAYLFQVKSGGTVQYCKIVCDKGEWRGPYCGQTRERLGERVFRHGCHLQAPVSGLQLREGHRLVPPGQTAEYGHGALLLARCTSPSQALQGSNKMTCRDGSWSSGLPQCSDTSTREGFLDSLPPLIEFAVTGGPWTLGRAGQLIVRPGSIVHLDCIQDRRQGNPEWSWANTYKEFPTGWVIQQQKRNWHYRLSVIYAKVEDSGHYNCSSQRGLKNSLNLVVTELSCPPLVASKEVRVSSPCSHLGCSLAFSCPTGSNLNGANTADCRDDGTWSEPSPSCSPVQCPALEISSPHLRVLALNNSYLGEAVFDCPFGFQLTGGTASLWCTPSGTWSGPVPSCTPTTCKSPPPPKHGTMVRTGGQRVGGTVRTSCHQGFLLIGEPVIRCTEAGSWSHQLPFCKRACSFPTVPEGGIVSPIKFLYNVGDRISLECRHGLLAVGSASAECNSRGEWTANLPPCVDYRE